MVDRYQIKSEFEILKKRLEKINECFDISIKRKRLKKISKCLERSNVWSNIHKTQMINQEYSDLQSIIFKLDKLNTSLLDSIEIFYLACAENDDIIINDSIKELEQIKNEIEIIEFECLFSDPIDKTNAYIDIKSGSGGIEAQDWSEILLKMYLKWAEKHNFSYKIIDCTYGEIAGIKNVTVHLCGKYVYGWLKTESGVHRLVRKSPFDSGHKRHTSFAAVSVFPEYDNSIKIKINTSDLRIDTFRSSGAGGQHVNKTDSAVRITHYPSGIVVQCQTDRSQHRNKDRAMKQLLSKLYALEMKKKKISRNMIESKQIDINWGSQIRSYILDRSLIKDLRTGTETSNIQSVLNGNIDIFIKSTLQVFRK